MEPNNPDINELQDLIPTGLPDSTLSLEQRVSDIESTLNINDQNV